MYKWACTCINLMCNASQLCYMLVLLCRDIFVTTHQWLFLLWRKWNLTVVSTRDVLLFHCCMLQKHSQTHTHQSKTLKFKFIAKFPISSWRKKWLRKFRRIAKINMKKNQISLRAFDSSICTAAAIIFLCSFTLLKSYSFSHEEVFDIKIGMECTVCSVCMWGS